MPLGITDFIAPDFPEGIPVVQSGVVTGPLSFSAVGTIHHKEWICGGVGFIRIVQMA